MYLISANDTPKIPIYICAAATLVPASGLGGGTAKLIGPDGSVVSAHNTLVELDATNAKGHYTVQLASQDALQPGIYRLIYETPTTQANVGMTEFECEAYVSANITLVQGDDVAATNLTSSLQNANGITIASAITSGSAISGFPFLMRDSTNHQPVTGKTPVVTVSVDGSAFGVGALGAVTEIGHGWYKCDFSAEDTAGTFIILRATASGCDDTNVEIVTQS